MIHVAAFVASALLQAPPMPAVAIEDLGFLTGSWRGESHGSLIEETWLPPEEGNLTGVFRMTGDGAVQLVEIMTLTEVDDGIVYRLRHFDTALVPWKSEADGPIQAKAVLVDKDSVRFEFEEGDDLEAITYDRDGDKMTAKVIFPEDSGREAFVLVFDRVGAE